MSPSIDIPPIISTDIFYAREREELLEKKDKVTSVDHEKTIEDMAKEIERLKAVNKMYTQVIKKKDDEYKILEAKFDEAQNSLKPIFADLAKIQKKYEDDLANADFWSRLPHILSGSIAAVAAILGMYTVKRLTA